MFLMKTATLFLRNYSFSSKMSLQGKVAIVTASTEGIGFAIARRLAKDGASVVISSRKEKNVSDAVDKLISEGCKSVIGGVCHVSKKEHRENIFKLAVDKFGGIDILVSNAAANPVAGSLFDCPEDAWDKIFDVNIKSSFLLTKEVLPYMRKQGSGAVIYVTSIAGFQPINLLGAYSVSKTALLGLTKAASIDLAPDNIRVNAIAPGIIKTKFSSALHESESAVETMLNNIPMGRLGMPEDVAGVAAFLCSDDARYITGETVVVSGGMPSRL